ncbi:MAG: M48 family metalloprotease [Clostridiales bacterium]|nr:M48 family metalloprotease [Clostridiales bacterium]
MPTPHSTDFYEIQSKQRKKSILILAVLTIFYFAAIGLISLAVLASSGLFGLNLGVWTGTFLWKWLAAVLIVSSIIAFFHFYEARRTGAPYILKRLDARPPDLSDRYHQQFANVVEEMRIACALPEVNAYVLPQFAVNSMALVEPDGTPCVVVTEGLLADSARDELQAVVAHELGHISRGDAFYVTLVCSLANFLEKLREALEPEDAPAKDKTETRRGGASPVLIYLTVLTTSISMRLLSALLSREREILADAAAVEISRHPVGLARLLYKAHLKSSLIGDFGLTYSPLFIVAPQLTGESDGFFSRLFNSHPPLMKRVKLLARMAGLEPAHVIQQVWEGQKLREEARTRLYPFDDQGLGATKAEGSEGAPSFGENRGWLIQDSKGKWRGPFGLEEILFLPYFTPLRIIKSIQEDLTAQAREFPQIRLALERLRKKRPVDPSKKDRCPPCRVPLSDNFYEGVEIKVCSRCGGKLVDSAKMERILLRREFDFSQTLIEKARAFKEEFLLNPVKKQREKEKAVRGYVCPNCGYRMVPRPYNYQYFIPADKCLACGHIWFDADELEILQVLIEKKA